MTALVFQSTRFTVVDRNNQPWLRGTQIADALGYSDDKSIHRIYARHSDEFTGCMTGVVKLTTPSGEQETRIFSLRGAHLLAMLSRTPVAKEFRRWVLDILDRETAVPPAPTLPASLGRWILGFDGRGKPHMTQLGAKEAVINPDRLPEIINAPDSVFDDTLLLTRIAGACLGRLMPTVRDDCDFVPQCGLPPDVQAALDCKAWMLAAEAHKITHRHLRISVDISCAIGNPERYIDQPKAMEVIAKTILDDAITPHSSDMAIMELMADRISESAKNYADAVKAGTSALRKRGVLLGPVLSAGKAAALA